MDLQKILNFRIPKGTVLFADNACSTALSIMFTFDDLVPKKFTLICDFEKDVSDIQNLLERFISMLEFEHVALLISSPIQKYQKHIQTFLDFEFDIFKIFTTVQNDDYSMIPKNVVQKSDLIQEINQILIPITEHFSIIPSCSSLLPNILLGSSEDFNEGIEKGTSVIQNVLIQLLKKNVNNIKSFAYGDFSKKLAESLENGRKGDNTDSVALIIDRNLCCTPLFTNDGSLLDKAASLNLVSVLQDSNLIQTELNDNLLPTLCKILDIDEKSNLSALSKKWASLSKNEQFSISKKYPSIQYILDTSSNKDANLVSQRILSAQNSLLNGADFDDIFASYCVSLKPNQIFKIIGFQNCIHRINFEEYLSDIPDDNSSSIKKEKYVDILNNCYSGVSFDLKQRSTFKPDELLFLPNILNFIFDKNAAVNNEITAPSSGLMGFNLFKSTQPSLKSFKNVYVFVIGGISFHELALIEKMEKSKSTNTEFHIFSDTICSSIHLFD
ncbi:hypothetical protein M9Y10_014321 [Tritrichomonas musculus]|uniref:Sec1 family protein n=1 Tax=Tritrichomonas musculus TaxID=1915356 RepID=A0ABR2KZ75_9EUKA